MLTPSEEMGLSAMRLSARVRAAMGKLGDLRLAELLRAIPQRARADHLWYLHEGQVETVRLLARPMTALPEQLSYIHSVSQTVHRALKHLPSLYFSDPRVRAILQLPAAEEEWLRTCWGGRQRDANPVFGRLDAVVDFTTAHWKESLRFLEPNMSGIGGLHMLPTTDSIVLDVVARALSEIDPGIELSRVADIRDLLMQYVMEHLDLIGRPGRTICFIEPKYAGDGPDEQSVVAAYLHAHYDVKILHADPAELRIERGEVRYGDHVVDVGYRDYSVESLLELQSEGVDVSPMRQLFLEDRMVSSIAAEIDQKSCWEVFTDPELADAHFSTEERQVFRRHVLWTRLVSDRKTTLPGGGQGSLLEYVRDARDSLVLKPNRSFGGYGVTVGPAVDESTWTAAIERALRDPERWVVQALTPLPVHDFPVPDGAGSVVQEPFYTVYGFCPTSDGVAALGRASQKQVVNIAQHGGLFSLLRGQIR